MALIAGPSNAAQSSRPVSDWTRSVHTFDFFPYEEEFFQTLPTFWREDFRLFCIGYKVLRGWEEALNNAGRTVDEWNTLTKDEREVYINAAERTPDPRLDPRNFHFRRLERVEWESLPEDEQDRFENFVVGAKVRFPKFLADQGQAILRFWNRATPEQIKTCTDTGAEFFDLYKAQPKRRHPSSADDEHRYIEKSSEGGRVLPAPTWQDRVHVNDEMDQTALEGQWIFERTIYQGANKEPWRRAVHLFTKVDAEGNIVDRMIVKILGANSSYQISYLMAGEFARHVELSKKESRHILECYGYSLRMRKNNPQLGYGYMEYASCGDLSRLLTGTTNLSLQKQLTRSGTGRTHDPKIPEPFIWLAFRGMAEALYILHTGYTMPSSDPQRSSNIKNADLPLAPGWERMINVDIKPKNIVMSEPDADWSYPAFKVTKMIDFGLIYPEEDLTKRNIKLGTQGFRPPEHFGGNHRWSHEPVNAHSEIFNVGLVVLNLMERDVTCFMTPKRKPVHSLHYEANFKYSFRLERLVSKCVELAPKNRISLYNLLYETRVGLEKWEELHGSLDGMEIEELEDSMRMTGMALDEFRVEDKAPIEWGWRWEGVRKKRKMDTEDEEVDEDDEEEGEEDDTDDETWRVFGGDDDYTESSTGA